MSVEAALIAVLWVAELERVDAPTAPHEWVCGDAVEAQTIRGRNGELPISVSVKTVEENGERVCLVSVANSTTNLRVKCLNARPFTREVPDDFEGVYCPCGLGVRFPKLPAATDGDVSCGWARVVGVDRKRVYSYHCDWPIFPGSYPGYRATMAYTVLAGSSGGVYWACHDPAFKAKCMRPLYDPVKRSMTFSIDFYANVMPGATWRSAPVVESTYQGRWHAAAKRYRKWFDSVVRLPKSRVSDAMTGQLLCILKQQNGEIVWPYEELDALADAALSHGLDWVGLFGWTRGGHDHLYPDYEPDPAQGGEAALREGIRSLHAKGLRCFLYANGQLIEHGVTEFWNGVGKTCGIVRPDGGKYTQTWHKYANTPPHDFDLACLSGEAWYERMLSVARRAQALGADGILYDQLANSQPRPCYSAEHAHAPGDMVFADDKTAFLRRIRDEIAKTDPDFVLASEGLGDTLADALAFCHGMCPGAHPYDKCFDMVRLRFLGEAAGEPEVYPEFFRYTFPEVVSTCRMPSPILSRDYVNYDCIFGLRHDIEIRYSPDRRYVETGRMPDAVEYGTVLGPPDLKLMAETDQRTARDYLRSVCDFQRRWSKYLLRGRYCDDDGVSLSEGGFAAKRLEASDGTSAVLVWNPGDRCRTPHFTRPGAPDAASSPEHAVERVDEPVPPNSLRLYVFDGGDHMRVHDAPALDVRRHDSAEAGVPPPLFACDLDGARAEPPARPDRPILLVDDATDDAPFAVVDGKGRALGVTVETRRERRGAAEFIDVAVRNCETRDRALTVVYAQPLPGSDVMWLADPYTAVVLYGAERRETHDIGCGRNGVSVWPFGAVRGSCGACALGIDPAAPAVCRFAASARLGALYAACDVALTAEKDEAWFRLVSFGFDGAAGFRGALAAWQTIFPEASRVRIAKHGLWMPFKKIGDVKGWEDFGFAVKEGDADAAWDDDHGILTFHYTEPTSWWMHYLPKDGRQTAEGAWREAERQAAANVPLARSWRTSPYVRENGEVFMEIHNRAWITGALWCLSPLPGIPGGEFSVKQDEKAFAARHARDFPGGVDGEYIDSCEQPWMTPKMDFNRSSFRYAQTPLSWSPESRKPAIATPLAVYEYVRATAERTHARGKLTMANGTPCSVPWIVPYVDMCGSETRWLMPSGRWLPPGRVELLRYRALCGGKPFAFLMNGKFADWTDELVERYFARTTAFGFFSGFCTDHGGGADYFLRPELYERHRALFRKYVPLQKTLSEAGWRPVRTLLEAEDPQTFLEQFGERHVTLFNFGDKPLSVALRPLGSRVRARECISGAQYSFPCRLTLAPEAVAVLELD